MMSMRAVLVAVSSITLVACGSHQSVAPVVYGTQPTSQSRIYNSPEESRVARAVTPAPQYTPPRAAPAADVEPVRLQPVSAIYLSDEERERATKANYTPPSRAASAGKFVAVRNGDTVYALSRRHDVTPQEIIAENNLRAPYHLSVGQRIKIPGTELAAPTRKVVARDTMVSVSQGDTLYAISRRTGVSVDVLAQANGLRPPYTLSPGQKLLAPGASVAPPTRTAQKLEQPARQPQRVAKAEPARAIPEIAKQVSYTPPVASSDALFSWPVRGAIVGEYGIGELGRRNDGINIAAPAGTPVRAAADGEVVYRGSELDGFGNLLLLKHTDGFVTAYAHNDAMLVKKGDVVRKGQVIAKVGQTGAVTTPQLHFEIRQQLKSVDPLALLDD